MEEVVDAMSKAYDDMVAAMADVVEAKERSSGQRTAATDAALDKFKHRWELFMASCDGADRVVETARKRVASDHVADLAFPIARAPSAPIGIPPLGVSRLEQGFRAIFSVEKALRQQNADCDTSVPAAPASTDSSGGSSDEAKPSEEEAKPSEDEAKPSEDDAKPSEDDAKPSEDDAKPSEEEAKPSEDEAKPSEDEAKPSEVEAKPSDDEAKQ